MSKDIIKKIFVVGECEVPPIPPDDYCGIKASQIEACDSDNIIILESGSTIFNKPLELEGIISYSGNTDLSGKFLSGTTSGFVLADVTSIQTELGEATILEDVTSTLEIGGIAQGETINSGTTLTEFVKKLIMKVYNPTFTAPSFSLTQNQGTLREVGQTLNVLLTFNFNRGTILGNNISGVWNPTAVQNFRAGEAIEYDIYNQIQSSNIRTITGYVVIQGSNQFTGTVTYDVGPQPLNSNGLPYSTPLSGSTSSIQSASFEGVYPLFGTTSNITTSTKQSLVSMISGNNIQINLVAETGGNKQFFEIPDVWLSNRPLQSVQFFNTVSGQFDTTNKINTFDVSNVIEIIQGQNIGYKRYTNNDLNRGTLLIRLIF